MSTTTVDAANLDISGTPPTPFSRLVAVETRKLADTRAGRWLLFSIAALTALAMGIVLVVAVTQDGDLSLLDLTGVAQISMGILLPVLGILSVTSEWGQRTHMVTFTLEPHRTRVVLAKLAAGVLASLAAVVVALAIGAACNLLYGVFGSFEPVWNVGLEELVSFTILQVIGLLTGFAFGMVFMNTAVAIVLFFVYSFVLPGLFFAAAQVWTWAADLQPWLDFADAQIPMTEGDLGGVDWAQFAASGALWFALPLALGIWRLLRAEVK